jgi:endonuclease YncB( thermonuclease family)
MMSSRHTIVLSFMFLLILSHSAFAYSARRDAVAGPVVGEVTDVLDGDTVVVRLHVWIGENIETSVRIAGIDAPEIHGKCEKERRMALDAKTELARLLKDNKISLYDIRLEKYAGRVLAVARTADGTDIGTHMLDTGFARPYHGKKRGAWCS